MKLSVMICTLNEGIERVPSILLPFRKDVEYVVSFQYTSQDKLMLLPSVLKDRKDVRIVTWHECGLSRNRNHALDVATGDVLLVSDDDCIYKNEYFDSIIKAFKENVDADILLFQTHLSNGSDVKSYPSFVFDYPHVPKDYYPMSVEMAFRRNSIDRIQLRFNTNFGLGATYLCAGEEDVLLHDAVERGLKVRYVPSTIVETDADTTGLHFMDNACMQRTKGAVFYYLFGFVGACFRCFKEGLSYFVRKGANPFPLWKNMWLGIQYVRRGYENV